MSLDFTIDHFNRVRMTAEKRYTAGISTVLSPLGTIMSFETDFVTRLQQLNERALRAGSSMTDLCRRVGIARSTPDRWHKQVPKTVRIVASLEKALKDVEAGRG